MQTNQSVLSKQPCSIEVVIKVTEVFWHIRWFKCHRLKEWNIGRLQRTLFSPFADVTHSSWNPNYSHRDDIAYLCFFFTQCEQCGRSMRAGDKALHEFPFKPCGCSQSHTNHSPEKKTKYTVKNSESSGCGNRQLEGTVETDDAHHASGIILEFITLITYAWNVSIFITSFFFGTSLEDD